MVEGSVALAVFGLVLAVLGVIGLRAKGRVDPAADRVVRRAHLGADPVDFAATSLFEALVGPRIANLFHSAMCLFGLLAGVAMIALAIWMNL